MKTVTSLFFKVCPFNIYLTVTASGSARTKKTINPIKPQTQQNPTTCWVYLFKIKKGLFEPWFQPVLFHGGMNMMEGAYSNNPERKLETRRGPIRGTVQSGSPVRSLRSTRCYNSTKVNMYA